MKSFEASKMLLQTGLTNMKLKRTKYIVFIICSCALMYQSIVMYIDYKEYQTIVTVNIGKQSTIEYPGVSLCFSNPYINLTEPTKVYKLTKMSVPEGIWMKAKQRDYQRFKELINKGTTWKEALLFFLGQKLFMKDAFQPDKYEDEETSCIVKPTKENSSNEDCGHVVRIMGFYSECQLFFSSVSYNSTFQKVKQFITYQWIIIEVRYFNHSIQLIVDLIY